MSKILGNTSNLALGPADSGTTIIEASQTITNLSGGNFVVIPDFSDITFTLVGTTTSSDINNVTIILDPNSITLGNGKATIYGDIIDLTMSISGGVASGGATVLTIMENETITMAGNTITAGNGHHVVYGNLHDLTMIVGGNTAFDNSIAVDQFAGDTFNLGNNTITLGNGSNTVFGVMHELTLESTASTANGLGSTSITGVGDTASTDGIGNPFPLLNTFTLAGNHITVGNGMNVIYGDIQTLNVVVSGGLSTATGLPDTASFPFSSSDNEVLFINISMGPNVIIAGDGNNIIYGDIGDIEFQTIGGQLLGGLSLGNFIDANTITLQGNQITVGNGDNIIYGDMHDFSVTGVGGIGMNLNVANHGVGTQMQPTDSNSFAMGFNQITAGNGNNQVFGEMHDLTLLQSGGDNTCFVTGFVFPAVFSLLSNFDMGHNQITVGNGTDLVAGDMHDLQVSIVGGDASSSLSATDVVTRVNFSFGHNEIIAGKGSDVIYGDLHDLTLSVTGGLASDPGSDAHADIRIFNANMGDNVIHAGDGNDTIFGDLEGLSLTVQGGQVTNGGVNAEGFLTTAAAFILQVNIQMTSNHLFGGNGDDVLFGNLKDLSFHAQDGVVHSGTGDVIARFGGDILFADGNIVQDHGSTIAFGNDMLDGGAGNDFLCGDALNLLGFNDFLVNKNLILWGNDTLTGGQGADHFVWALDDHTGSMTMQGADIVTDFTPIQGDQLVFGNVIGANGNPVHDAGILDAVASFVDFTLGGENDVAIIFHETGVNPTSDYETQLGAFITTHPSATLQDVAQFIYQSSTATAFTGAGDVRDAAGNLLPPTGSTLASNVPTAEAPEGAVILEGHSTAQAGFASFIAMQTELHNALTVNHNTPAVHA
jgi:hypothetical protein